MITEKEINDIIFEANNNILSCSKIKVSNVEEKPSPMEIIIKPDILDTSSLQDSEQFKEYRPVSWNEYIGQQEAKEKLQDLIKGSKEFDEVFPHIFISGYSGMGKTLLATILANDLKKKIGFTTGGELKTPQMFVDKISEYNILFIDEANRINKQVGFFILPIMEQFKIAGRSIKPFTLIFATTHVGDISKDLDALIQRCEQISLQPYKNEELKQIVKQYAKKQYPSVNIEEGVFDNIINNCRQVPRMAKNLVKAFSYTNSWEKVKRYNNIVVDGLTYNDIKALKYLNYTGGASKSSVAGHLRMKAQNFEYDVEPYLIYKELIEISNKRKISEKGKLLLEGLK